MKTKDPYDPVVVFAGTTWQAGMVKSLLEDAGISAFIKDEIMGTLKPWWTAPGGAGAVSVYVSVKDFEEARAIVAGYEMNMKEES
jgi:hypothetical protein